ncbi:hypothetical protein HY477_01205 [Candidatus Uhrbacteria bacterium]|nr:hypothetical protein [Candidatus Uhrbacteria bacterium]
MLRTWGIFFRNAFITYSLIGTAALIVANFLVLGVGIEPSADPIFLHYTTYLGVDFVGAWYLVYLIPVSALCIGILNTVLAYFFSRRDILFAQLFTATATLVALFLLIYSILVVRLNS